MKRSEQEFRRDKTRHRLRWTFSRVQGREREFSSITVECGSWFSAYQYVYEKDPSTGKDVTDFSTDIKSMDNVECVEDGKGKVIFTINGDIIKREKGKQDGKMEPRTEKDRKSAD